MNPEVQENLKLIVPLLVSLLTILATWQTTKRTKAESEKKTNDIIAQAVAGNRQDIEQLWEQNKLTQQRADNDREALVQSNGKISTLWETNGQLKNALEEQDKLSKQREEEAKKTQDTLREELTAANTEIHKLLKSLEQRIHNQAELETKVAKLEEEARTTEPLKLELEELRVRVNHLEEQLVIADTEQRAALRNHQNERLEWQGRENELNRNAQRKDTRIKELIADLEKAQETIRTLEQKVETLESMLPVPVATLVIEPSNEADTESSKPEGDHPNEQV